MSHYQPRSMLVTGGAGFIGSNFIRYVLTHFPDVAVVNLDKLTYAGSLDNLTHLPHAERHHFIQGDITDAKLLRHILMHHHIDTIVHFAAESHVDRSITAPAAFVQTNVLGTFVLLEAARHHWFEIEECGVSHCRFHHISTDEVYGSLQTTDPLFTEKTAYDPHSPYSASKAGADHLARAYYHTYGLPVTISHCSNNYGPYQHAEKFIPTVIQGCLSRKPIPVYGNGKNIRDWLYVDDHCRAIMTIIEQGKVGESYNIGGNNEWENIALARFICEQMDKIKPHSVSYATLLEFVKDRPGHDFRYAIDNAKIKAELGWSPQETLESGIMKTIAFYLHQPAHAYQ
ncbi:dTDP-glucose 4,6-dehydratase [Aquicella lusitana]|uniref:dTDP-glucose 4,6-dehydratase n=1 Tax=Aquicella lusitana TaxID=254246 RepID=A0A370GS83_9COXI|nr:dTDP-glucose 4,6-dehydratase [Aquicella lusitana]RDI44793.1 dTDP-glucose 4,6-dehydratase [Aquicella lusitana]VVC72990.1 dTDP-glucose 4,6-dehydratase 2 [Aquicella lusitana]